MTNKIVLRSVEEFLTGFKPTYMSIMALFLANSQSYAVEAGKLTFTRAETIGDIRSKMIGPKDTEMHQIHSKEGSKVFKKWFLGSQYVQSALQDTKGYEDVLAQVLDEHNKQADELLLGDSNNSGLFTSTDANYNLITSYEVQKDAADDHLADFYAKIVSIVQTADEVAGKKLVMIYGANAISKFNSLFVENKMPLTKALADALPDVTFAKMPSAITPANSNGFIVVNLDNIKLHYTTLPKIDGQGVNEEKKYTWTNFLMGSTMLEVLAANGIMRQPVTFEA